MSDYSPYSVVLAEGARIGLMTCLRCGAAVIVDETNAAEIHSRFHDEDSE